MGGNNLLIVLAVSICLGMVLTPTAAADDINSCVESQACDIPCKLPDGITSEDLWDLLGCVPKSVPDDQ